MLKKIFTLALGLVLAMPFVLFAEEQEVEIELIEVVGAGVLPGKLEGCVVTLKNVDVQDQINVTINPVVEAELISNVEIPLGSTLIIN